jgi:hypothetical protein
MFVEAWVAALARASRAHWPGMSPMSMWPDRYVVRFVQGRYEIGLLLKKAQDVEGRRSKGHDKTVGQECQDKSDLYTIKTNASHPEIGRSLTRARFLGMKMKLSDSFRILQKVVGAWSHKAERSFVQQRAIISSGNSYVDS